VLSEFDRALLTAMRTDMNHAFDCLGRALVRANQLDADRASLRRDLERLRAMRVRTMLKFNRIKGFL
jgi:hypothetical protein